MSDARVGKRGEQKRRWDNENLKGRGLCTGCGEAVWKKSTRCPKCSVEAQRSRYREIERRWKAGESAPEIAAALGIDPAAMSAIKARMRRDGWDLPYRYNIQPSIRAAA